MPAAAFGILLFFTVAAIVVGAAVTWLIGPRRPIAMVLPILAAFGALYVVGHRSGLAVGPTVELFGFQVNLLFGLAAAALLAGIAAKAQCMLLTRRAARRAVV